ncbi:hypothetical protein [Pseudotabrizicola formosa]|uniref:hypothetical protein n=1 Tax=Pseudotabrizicola formosa TaxID=2030009 RepID=UPI000CD14FE9|nr:hypothetical protein [Pseudotabrizicola formosa]
MKSAIIPFAIASQLLAFGAVAQSSAANDTTTPISFGSDWSTSLGTAMFGDDGSTVRPSAELAAQWITLSEEDKAMVQRDCAAYGQHSSGPADATVASAGTAGASDAAAMDGDTTVAEGPTVPGMPSVDSRIQISVSMDQMEEICTAVEDM